MKLTVQAARWLKTVVELLKKPELAANHVELEGLRPNMEEILACVVYQRVHE
jgi:hypothetical protein